MKNDLPMLVFVFECLKSAAQRRGFLGGGYYVIKDASVVRFLASDTGRAALDKVGVGAQTSANMRLSGKAARPTLFVAAATQWVYLSLDTYDHIAKLAMGGPLYALDAL